MGTANFSFVEEDAIKIPMISEEKVLETTKKIAENEATSLTSIANKAVNAAVKITPNVFTEAFKAGQLSFPSQKSPWLNLRSSE